MKLGTIAGGMASLPLLSDRGRGIVTAFVSSAERLDVLLYLRGLRGRSASAETVARACGIPVVGAEWHLACLCSCGFLGVTIGSELVYAFRPLTVTMRTVVEELNDLNAQRRADLLEAIRTTAPARALIAESDADMRDLLQGALEARGCHVVTVASGREGLTRSAGDSFTLAVVDLRACRSDGLALLRALRTRDASLPLIVTTTVRDARLDRELAGLRIRTVLEKPFELEELCAILESCRGQQDCGRSLRSI